MTKIDNTNGIKPYQSSLVKAWNCAARLVPNKLLSPTLSLDGLTQSARKATGCTDFGTDTFLEPLQQLLDALEDTGDLHPFGRFYVKTLITGMLEHRLRLTDLWTRHPEILDESVRSPLIILGLFRAGTSFLVNLLAQDPAHRFLANWEVTVSQVPHAGSCTFENDPRRRRGRFLMGFQRYVAPGLMDIHPFELDGPEECTPLLMQGFTTEVYNHCFNVPSFAEWINSVPRTGTYEHHKRILQTLQRKYSGERWLLKSPLHIEAIDTLLEAYPNACIVHMHRDPVKCIPSLASLWTAFRSICTRSIDLAEVGTQVMNDMTTMLERYSHQRATCDSSRFCDVHFRELIQDPLGTVRRIYERFDLPYTTDADTRFQTYVEQSQSKNISKHAYSAQQFGLSAREIRDCFRDYIDAFCVDCEETARTGIL